MLAHVFYHAWWVWDIKPPPLVCRLLVRMSALGCLKTKYGWCVCTESVNSRGGLKVCFVMWHRTEYRDHYELDLAFDLGMRSVLQDGIVRTADHPVVLWPTQAEAERHLMVLAMRGGS
jgi:hypothetical protein